MSLTSQRLHSRRGHTAASQSLANLRVVQSEGSIDSLFPERSPLRAFSMSRRSRELHARRRQGGIKLSSPPSPSGPSAENPCWEPYLDYGPTSRDFDARRHGS